MGGDFAASAESSGVEALGVGSPIHLISHDGDASVELEPSSLSIGS